MDGCGDIFTLGLSEEVYDDIKEFFLEDSVLLDIVSSPCTDNNFFNKFISAVLGRVGDGIHIRNAGVADYCG